MNKNLKSSLIRTIITNYIWPRNNTPSVANMKFQAIALVLPVTKGLDYPVGITNCGVPSWINAKPNRAVTMNQGTTEIMLALGLHEDMVGTAYLVSRLAFSNLCDMLQRMNTS